MIVILLAIFGLMAGSFVNALIWRLHKQTTNKGLADKKLSILRGRSMCVHCHHILAPKDLIPVFSWLILRGRCRYCHKPIYWQYPVVELLTALLFVASYLFWPYGFDALGIFRFVIWLAILTGFVALIVYDLRWMLLPNRVVYPLIALAVMHVAAQLVLSDGRLTVISTAFWGFVCSGGLFYLLFQLSKGRWIGGGDVKLGFMLGPLLGGPVNSLLMLFAASLLGTLVAVPLILSGKASRDTHIPFGPFLIMATITVYLGGDRLITWYGNQLLLTITDVAYGIYWSI